MFQFYTPWKPEKQRFSIVFRGYKMGTFSRNKLIVTWQVFNDSLQWAGPGKRQSSVNTLFKSSKSWKMRYLKQKRVFPTHCKRTIKIKELIITAYTIFQVLLCPMPETLLMTKKALPFQAPKSEILSPLISKI